MTLFGAVRRAVQSMLTFVIFVGFSMVFPELSYFYLVKSVKS